jgi:hypothetical protein
VTNNYDHITTQFAPALSDLARRMYAAIVEGTSNRNTGNYLPAWEIALKENIRLGDDPSSEGDDAIHELFGAGLVEQAPRTEWSFRLTSAAWRAHLLAERAALNLMHAALSETVQHLANYDWNADPLSLTRMQGDAFAAFDGATEARR